MSGIYTVQFNAVTVTAQQDLIQLTAHASKQCVLLGFGVSQTSEVTDAQEEMLAILIKSGQGTTGSGGSAPTPGSTDGSGAASGFAAQANNTTKASTGTIVTHYPYSWNVRIAMDIVFTDQQQIIFGAGRRLTIELATTVGDSVTMNGYAVVQEIG